MQTAYNCDQRRQRLEREASYFAAQVERHAVRSNAQEKRAHTLVVRCLKRRMADLEKLTK